MSIQNQLSVIASQMGGSALVDNKTHVNRIEIRSASSNRVYTVALSRASGQWECSCPGWVMKKPGKERSCKHLDQMLPALQKIGEAPKALSAKASPLPVPEAKAKAPEAKKPTQPKTAAPAPAAPSKDVVLDSATVAKLKDCLKDMESRGVVRAKLQSSVRELIETLEGAIK